MAGGVQLTTARRLGHSSTHSLTQLSTTQAGGRGYSFPHRPPGLFSFLHQLEAKQRGFTGRNSSRGRQTSKLQGPLWSQVGQSEGGSMWLEVHLSRLFAKVNWGGGVGLGRGSQRYCPRKKATCFLSFCFFFVSPERLKKVCVKFKHTSV